MLSSRRSYLLAIAVLATSEHAFAASYALTAVSPTTGIYVGTELNFTNPSVYSTLGAVNASGTAAGLAYIHPYLQAGYMGATSITYPTGGINVYLYSAATGTITVDLASTSITTGNRYLNANGFGNSSFNSTTGLTQTGYLAGTSTLYYGTGTSAGTDG